MSQYGGFGKRFCTSKVASPRINSIFFGIKGELHFDTKSLHVYQKNHKDATMGVLCRGVCFSWLTRGGVATTAGPIRSPSLGRVKLNGISTKKRVWSPKMYNSNIEALRQNSEKIKNYCRRSMLLYLKVFFSISSCRFINGSNQCL